jgi:hypothetical protein
MANLIPACSLAGNWACWRIVCKVASCDPRLRCTTLNRTLLDELSAHHSDLNLTHNTYKRQTSILPDRIRTHNLSKRTAADPRRTPHGNWDQPFWNLVNTKYSSGLSFTVPLCSSLKCLFVSCLQKSEIQCTQDGLGVRIYTVWKCGLYESRMSKSQGLLVLTLFLKAS